MMCRVEKLEARWVIKERSFSGVELTREEGIV